MSSEKRSVPWFKVFAANDMAGMEFYGLNAGERGLLDSMKRCCWIDGCIPREARLLARVVRLDMDDVTRHLTAAVLAHFICDQHDSAMLRSPEIDLQRDEVAAIREAQRRGGEKGAKVTNDRAKNPRKPLMSREKTRAASTPASQGRVPSITSPSITSTPSLGSSDSFIAEYEATERAAPPIN
jgi:hypothetical protein